MMEMEMTPSVSEAMPVLDRMGFVSRREMTPSSVLGGNLSQLPWLTSVGVTEDLRSGSEACQDGDGDEAGSHVWQSRISLS